MAAPFERRPSGAFIAKRAWVSVFEAWGEMRPLFLSASALSLVLGLATFYGPSSLWLTPQSQDYGLGSYAEFLAIQAGLTLAWTFVAAPVAVALHRFILMGKITSGFLSFSPHYVRRFLIWAAAVKLSTLILVPLPDLLLRWNSAAGTVVGLAIALVDLVAFVYLTMIFPAVAIEVQAENWRARITHSVEQIRGNFWLVVRSGILAFLPLMVIYLVLWILFGGVRATLLRGDLRESFRFGLAAVTGMFSFFSILIGAAVVSWLYAWATYRSVNETAS